MSTFRLLVALMLVAGTAVIADRVAVAETGSLSVVDVPYAVGSWQGSDAGALDVETAQAIAADQVVNRTYSDVDGAQTGLYVAYYNQQRPGVSIHSPLHCLPGTGWDVLSNETLAIELGGGAGGHVHRLVAQKAASRVLVLYWYSINGEMIASELGSRLQLLSNRVRLGRNDAALVRVVVPVTSSDAEAERQGVSFVRMLAPHFLERQRSTS